MAATSNNDGPFPEFDGVDEYLQVGETTSRRVYDLIHEGNKAFREGRLEEAISVYSKAQRLQPSNPVILSNRSAAYCRYSQQLRNRPAALSEIHALMGMDPMMHAEFALKDAERVLNIQSGSPKSYYRKAMALTLLERYEDARETLLSGLQVDPSSIPLRAALCDLEKEIGVGILDKTTGQTKRAKVQRTDDFDCTLCFKLLYDPVTTPCGHTFCRACLFQSMDHGNKCPICRTVLFVSPRTYPISVTLNNIIQKNFPEEYAERKAEHDALTHLGIHLLPLFVMDVVLPCQKLSLNIFEPRYRLMVRRIMEGNHRMGMVGIDSETNSIADVACEVEICECEPLPDGRFYLEVEGRRRFHIIRSWDQDGYRVAEVEWIRDVCPLDGTKEKEDLQQMARGAAELARSWIRQARDASREENEDKQVMVKAMIEDMLDIHFGFQDAFEEYLQDYLLDLHQAQVRPTMIYYIFCMAKDSVLHIKMKKVKFKDHYSQRLLQRRYCWNEDEDENEDIIFKTIPRSRHKFKKSPNVY